MTHRLNRLRRDERGALGLEFGIAIPILVALMLGVLQFALVLGASGSMRDAMGEGLRLAKVNRTATADQVTARARSRFDWGELSDIQTLTFSRTTQSNGIQLGTMTMTYAMQPVIPFVPLPSIQLTETKTIYLPV